MTDNLVMIGFVASLLAGLATFVGALPILVMGRPSERQENLMLGFAAGVMLAAAVFSLIIPGFDQAREMGSGPVAAGTTIVAALLIGAVVLAQLNAVVPPLDRIGLGPRAIADARFRKVWLFVAAITLHNFPEGLAVGTSFGGGDLAAGTATAIGIGLQNLPEGFAVAGALAALGYSARTSVLLALASGLVEPVGGLIGAALVALSAPLLPWAMGFAAGAMIYVVLSEIIPDLQARLGGMRPTLPALMAGLLTMTFLDTTLG